MKKIILILVVIVLISCKKKEVTPVEPEPVCTITADDFSGKYFNANNDTIEVVFLHNNCPTNKSNTYLVKKLGEAVQSELKPSHTFEMKNYEFTVDGTTNFGTSVTFQLNRENTGNLIFNSIKVYNSIKFYKTI